MTYLITYLFLGVLFTLWISRGHLSNWKEGVGPTLIWPVLLCVFIKVYFDDRGFVAIKRPDTKD